MAKLVHYEGNVQGVGFRATVATIARYYPVTGWVKNLPDGRVQLLAEGRDDDIQLFLAAVRERWADHIETEQVEGRESTGGYTGFGILG